ncbi:hypothetical protein PM082_000771 [Marasmius tenuissimus]|nr:hypothetical protein PM082_000771 [Marasmius tenuissimus]
MDVCARTLNISHVCSRWRTVINAIPKLWSSFHIDIYKIQGCVSSIIGIYINRSQEHPLYVCLTDKLDTAVKMGSSERSKVERYFGGRGLEAADALLGAAKRFEELKLDMDGGLIDSLVSWETPGIDKGVDFCRLKVLKMTRTKIRPREDSLFWKSAREAPKLTHLSLDAHPMLDYASLSLPHITSIDLLDIDFLNPVLRVLHRTPSLERLMAFFSGGGLLDRSEFPATITAKSLRHFSLDGPDTGEITRLFSRLILPSMTSLEIVIHSKPNMTYSTQPILDILQRSSCSLQELVMRLPLHLPDLSKLIRSCPSLTSLEILLPAIPEASTEITEFLSQLTVREFAAALAPGLLRLHIHASDHLSWDAEVVEELVKALDSRARHGCLNVVRLSFHHNGSQLDPDHKCTPQCRPRISPAFRESIRTLQAGGVDCAIEHRFYLSDYSI